LEGIRLGEGKYSDFYLNLGSVYYLTQREAEGRVCMERVLEDDPKNPTALGYLGEGKALTR
jgi:hypothetical protein